MGRHCGFLCLCWLCLCAGCEPRQRSKALDLPGIDPAAAAALAIPGSPECTAFLRAASTDRLISMRATLLDARVAAAGLAAALLDAMDTQLAEARGLATYREESVFLAGHPDSTALLLLARRREADAIFSASDLDADTKLARIGGLQAAMLARGDAYGALQTWSQLAILEQRRGRPERAEACRRKWTHHAARLGRLDEQCGGYSQLMMGRMVPGWSPAERDTLRALIDRASRAGLARATSTLVSMLAYDAFNTGQYFTARTLFQDGIEICSRLGEPTAALSTLVLLMRMYAAFECWDQVAILAERADRLLDEAVGEGEPSARQRLTWVQLRNLEATRLAAGRRPDAAHAAFAACFAAARALPFEEASFVCRQWVEAMIDQERGDLAAAALATVDSPAVATDFQAPRTRLAFWRAWLAWQRGDLAAASAGLDAFTALLSDQPEAAPDLAFPAVALRVRLEACRDRGRALGTLRDGWRALQHRVLSREKGTEAYLDLGRNPHLRWVAQELVADDPELGYGLDLLWREAMLSRTTPLARVDDLLEAARTRAAAARRHLAATGSVHCLYRIGREGVTRWTVSGTAAIREVLATPVDTLRGRTTALLAALATDPGEGDAAIPAAVAADLAELAGDLLPARFLEPGGAPRQLAITGDGFLTQFPFASLNVGPADRYLPLAATTVVVWRRHGLAALDATGRETLQAVGDPTLNAATCRRFSLAEDLPGARAELQRVAALLPGREVVSGAAATGERMRELWDAADVLYFVGHAITDVQVPFASWLPLSAGGDAAAHPGIGMQDILGREFRRCRVVVLSGCATGRPYVDGLSTAPSLGDAFLDAGVEATVQTFWHVRDRSALIRPERIVAAWRDEGLDLASALAAEQRRVMVGPSGMRHPFAWAAWTVELSGSGR